MKKKIIIISVVVFVLVIVSILILQIYNINNRTKIINGKVVTSTTDIIADNIKVDYKEGVFLTDEFDYIEFDIKGNNSENVIYDVNIKRGKDVENKTRVADNKITFTLLKKVNDNDFITVVDNVRYKDLSNFFKIYMDILPKNKDVVHTYRLLMKIDNKDSNSYANVEVRVNGNVNTKYKSIG